MSSLAAAGVAAKKMCSKNYMLRHAANAVRRQPVIAALVFVAVGLAIFLLVRAATKDGFKYNCEEPWATCKSATNGLHCYWGPKNQVTNGMCCPSPWEWRKDQCSKPAAGAGGIRRVVTFHDNANYGGALYSYDVTDMVPGETKDLAAGFESFNDKISSVKVPYGYQVIVWGGAGFSDEKLVLEADTPDLTKIHFGNNGKGWSDKISSAQVYRKPL